MKLLRRPRPRMRVVLILAGAAALLASGTAVAVASGQGGATHSRNPVVKPLIAGESTGGGCRMGYDTQSATLIPPDDSTADNVPAGVVNIRKPCPGAVVGQFVAETGTSTAGDFIHIDMRATCTGTGGLASPCTVGQQVFASPGHTFMQNVVAGTQTHSVNMVWSGLPRGLWRFEVLPGGNNRANLQFRTFVVEAFNGG